MKQLSAFLTIAAACCAAPAEDIPPPREAPGAKCLSRDERFASRGHVDLYVASTAALDPKAEDERLWTPPLKLKAKVIELAELKGDRRPGGSHADFAAYQKSYQPHIIRTDGVYTKKLEKDATGQNLPPRQAAINAGRVKAETWLMGLVVSRGPVDVKTILMDSLILANGDVAARDIVNSVVICDGDVDVSRVMKSLIVAHGKIEVKEAFASTLIAGGEATAGKVPPPPKLQLATNPDIQRRNQAALAEYEAVRVEIKKNEPNPLGYVTFFELARVGLEVKVADKAVAVAKVAAGSAAEKTGLKAGDVVLEAGGKRPSDAESLRHLLRDALAVGDAAVKIQRGEDTLSVKLSLPE